MLVGVLKISLISLWRHPFHQVIGIELADNRQRKEEGSTKEEHHKVKVYIINKANCLIEYLANIFHVDVCNFYTAHN